MGGFAIGIIIDLNSKKGEYICYSFVDVGGKFRENVKKGNVDYSNMKKEDIINMLANCEVNKSPPMLIDVFPAPGEGEVVEKLNRDKVNNIKNWFIGEVNNKNNIAGLFIEGSIREA